MYKYSLKGHCPRNRDKAFCEVEEIINCYGIIVAFDKFSELSMNLIIEVEEKQVESLMFDLEKYMSLSDLKLNESKPTNICEVLIKLSFSN